MPEQYCLFTRSWLRYAPSSSCVCNDRPAHGTRHTHTFSNLGENAGATSTREQLHLVSEQHFLRQLCSLNIVTFCNIALADKFHTLTRAPKDLKSMYKAFCNSGEHRFFQILPPRWRRVARQNRTHLFAEAVLKVSALCVILLGFASPPADCRIGVKL